MTWRYHQASGALEHDGESVAHGYSGKGDGKNNPALESVHNVGPIPRGKYLICAPHDTRDRGPYVLALDPDPENEMHGRSSFLMHGDSKTSPGEASEGCIIMPRSVREQVWESDDRELIVT